MCGSWCGSCGFAFYIMSHSHTHLPKKRITFISVCILLVAAMLVVKLYTVQILNGNEFAERADRQYQRPSSNIFSRGNIYFTQKDGTPIGAATVKTGFILAINPKLIQKSGPNGGDGTDMAFNKLNDILKKTSTTSSPDSVSPLEYEDFIMRAHKDGDTYEELRRKIDEDMGEKIAAAKIPGVMVYRDKWRYYPGGQMAAHALGILGYDTDGSTIVAQYGLEKSYDATLGRNSDDVYVNFFAEMFSNIKKTVVDHEKLEGDIVTSIEPDTQQYVEKMLEQITRAYSSEKSGAIIMDPKTGAIIAMGLAPTYDPNDLRGLKDIGVLKNSLVQDVYEMGSVMKPLTMSVGIDTGKVNANTVYHDTGSVTMNNKTIYNFDKKGRGDITLQTALSQSLNTGFVFVAQKVGNQALGDYFRKYGFGEKTGIDLPYERTGLISNLSTDRDIEFATASFGQGIAVTPIEFIRAYTAIANGGQLVNPHIVSAINYRLGYTDDIKTDKGSQIIKPETAKAVTDMMVYNVDNSLLQGNAKNPRYAVAAKTGTAQIVNSEGKYSEDRFLHSFVGFLPAYNPRFLVFMYTVNPRGVSYASETLAKPFIELTKFLINNFSLPPDR
jgi:cell division protein FtsI/penicillin-binding protein 2